MMIGKIYVDELKKQREILRIYKRKDSKKISVGKNIALTIKDIAKTMEIFMKEKDLFLKVKQIMTDTASGITGTALFFIVASVVLTICVGGSLTVGSILSTLAICAPSAAYIGLASLIRNIKSKSEFE